MSILSLFDFSPEQNAAVLSKHPAVAVTAGAGSGKTRTLVGRYLHHVEQGQPVRALVAVTFTEKAAREMRNRIRQAIVQWRQEGAAGAEKPRWDQAYIELDAARIGTIHSLCAAILRAHPAEAKVDPLFEVLDENTSALLRARAVEQALAWAVEDPAGASLFGPLDERSLRQTLADLLDKRLDARPTFQVLGDDARQHWSAAARAWFEAQWAEAEWQQALADLEAIGAHRPDDRMEVARKEVLACWQEVLAAHAAGDWERVITTLAAMRKANSHYGAKGNWRGDDLSLARQAMRSLRQFYDDRFKDLFGAELPSWALDERAAALLPVLNRLFERALYLYDGMKNERQALDFDDLERMTVDLLAEYPSVRTRWQDETSALLVDEFQDTNARQQEIIYHIAGFSPATHPESGPRQTGSLFIVGDSKQSIYRFRGADVTVFRQTQADIEATGGQALALDTTYRGHHALVQTLNALLAPIMGAGEDAQQPFRTPFRALAAHRTRPAAPVDAPFLEFHLGLGAAQEGRVAAATALARRLQRLHAQGCAWQDIALLFRASTTFGVYEDALEAAGIPFVTVAGRGFYDRPEVRDLLNALTAIADRGDDLAMAGLLRSPLFGLSDAALFLLRWGKEPGGEARSFWQALGDDTLIAGLPAQDARRARRARSIMAELHEETGRQPVAFVLKQLLDRTHYGAALQLSAQNERARRNVDKLLADAHHSGLTGVSDFLEYVQSLRDVGARESEGASAASDAVQLMTIHKAKGLEFAIVVLADASYAGRYASDPLLLDRKLGPLLRISDDSNSKARPLIYQLGRLRAQAREEAEELRLLYVAATRARDALLISAYCGLNSRGRLQGRGWLKALIEHVGLDECEVPDPLLTPTTLSLPWQDGAASLSLYPALQDEPAASPAAIDAPEPAAGAPPPPYDLVPLLTDLQREKLAEHSVTASEQRQEAETEGRGPRVWRVAARRGRQVAPHRVVGILVHKALQHWRFPDGADFAPFLRPFARESGLTTEATIDEALRAASRILRRFQEHELCEQLDRSERHHEVAYSVIAGDGQYDYGVVDLLARSGPGEPWTLYDFKTDDLGDEAEMKGRIEEAYAEQLERYVTALEQVLGQQPQARLVFLDVGGRIVVR